MKDCGDATADEDQNDGTGQVEAIWRLFPLQLPYLLQRRDNESSETP